jgi:hypothetical protein
MALARALKIGWGLKSEHSDVDAEETNLNATDHSAAGCVGVDIDPITCAYSEESTRREVCRTMLECRVGEQWGSDELVVKKVRFIVLFRRCGSLEES